MKNQIERAERNAEYDDPRSMGNCMKHGDYDGRNIRCPKCERAEPSRGAPDAAEHEPDAFEAAWLDYNKAGVAGGWEKVAFVGGFGRGFKAGRETGHVVLLEALRELVESCVDDSDRCSICREDMASDHRHSSSCPVLGAETALNECQLHARTDCSQSDRDRQLLAVCDDPEAIFYGPHRCENCQQMICKVANEQGGMKFNYPEGIIYPNTNWVQHVCVAEAAIQQAERT